VLTLALSKGRIYDEAVELLSRIGIEPTVDPGKSRKLILPSNREGLQFLIIRASDVPTYVEYGAADLGIAGKDVLAEYETEGLYEPLDLGIASCRLMTAGRKGLTFRAGERPRVATKYVKTAHRFLLIEAFRPRLSSFMAPWNSPHWSVWRTASLMWWTPERPSRRMAWNLWS